MPDFTVVIVTRDRAHALHETLGHLARVSYGGEWEAIVADNNSSDDTRQIVARRATTFPVALRYLRVEQPGKYHALNAAVVRATGRFVASTDDDARPAEDWLARAAEGFVEHGCDFVGGPVYPLWTCAPPSWLSPQGEIAGKVLGLQNHGPAPRDYGCGGISWPLGVNVAYRRQVFDRVGLFDGRLGRVAGTLRNQSQREWHLRARMAGVRGVYLPHMIVGHTVTPDRLRRGYFHRWFYWHGISRAILYRTRGVHLLEPDGPQTHASELHLAGVPASLWRDAGLAILSAGRRWMLGDFDAALEYELRLSFCAGVLRQRCRDRGRPPAPGAGHTVNLSTTSPSEL